MWVYCRVILRGLDYSTFDFEETAQSNILCCPRTNCRLCLWHRQGGKKPNTVGLPPSYGRCTGSFQPTLKTFTPRPAAAGASMNLIWHLGQQPEAGYSAKRVRASASVALHVKKRSILHSRVDTTWGQGLPE